MESHKILVIGSANTDMVVKTSRLPKPGETILGGDFFLFPGGKGANQAVACARLGGAVTFVCNLGNDVFGKEALEGFKKDKIDTSFITLDDSQPSGVAVITVNENAENTIVVAPGANGTLNAEKVLQLASVFEQTEIILTQLETPIEATEAMVKMTKKYKKRLIINPAPARELSLEILDGLFLITPNETETELLTGIYPNSPEKCLEASTILLKKGVDHVIITLGKEGAFYASKNENFLIKSEPVKAIDTTAAGDVFNGALTLSLAQNKPWKDAILFANKAAAISVTKMGAQSSAPYLKDLTIQP
ncbi:ribokinase [Arcticibacterium luteifluviistationis]|uniref:Ribokinase n=1 Tax=Arcticibacterium luteifluviistationis TaxID=1784714 RepID=A0A2Z4GEI3_9BACT|nr:ribokinase [Arcticibacterium luteifluviistationis]AWV99398.1 ribokinase [Arcticibacterium luteifluviistationis]